MLQTQRLYLRNLCDGDADVLFEYRNDVRCYLYQRYENTEGAYLQEFVGKFSDCVFLSLEEEQHFAVACRDDGVMIGDLSVFFSEQDNCFTLGITISPLYQGQGYAHELLQDVISCLRQRYPSVDIVALIDKENARSIALFKKLGFVEECYAESIQSYVFTFNG